jgi:A/G-specific adenine glycosylase
MARLWEVAEGRLPKRGIEAYTQGMMDLGARVCTARKPACEACPVAADCVARIQDRVDELPGRRTRKRPPRRRLQMLVVLSHGEVLLEKRPPSGIWGGLWSLPEIDAGADPAGSLRREWGLAARSAEALPPFEHAFTHFTLEVTPWLLRPKRVVALARGRAASWLPLSELAGAALPSPVKSLLRKINGVRLQFIFRSASASSGTGAARRGEGWRR